MLRRSGPKPGTKGTGNFYLACGGGRGVKIDFTLCMSTRKNSIAFGKSTMQRIYPKQHAPKIG